ncbi:MAG: ATP-binding protein [Okeania sp. SIO2C9]|uniref:NB-ARC domain-containing protein n=1 Tax=Okeania sp. SIO2C9 TaxID=2607791 RepID=UPI0013BF7844|nr:NB-ARC domain-containing protein [Okeania sp. SIO2C9]NEQ77528.1 ATP-binding protein [Okeania sp. SIO2C9]
MNGKAKRKRGRILTDEGFQKLKDAVNKEFPYCGIQPTDKEFNEILDKITGDFSLDTLKKIWKREENADTKYIKAVAETFGLNFKDGVDYIHKDDIHNTAEQKNPSSPATAETDTDIEDSNLRWVGRAELIFDLRQNLLGELRVISIVGITGIGKTSLAIRLSVDEYISNSLTPSWVRFYNAPTKTFDVVAQQVLGEKLTAQPQLQQDREALLQVMINELQLCPTLLIIDMLEVVLIPDGKGGHSWQESIFGDFLERIILAENMPSRVILTSQYSLPVLAQGRYDEFRLLKVPLKGLTDEESLRLFEGWKVSINNNQTEDFLKRIINIYEGHPLALKLIAGDILNEPYEGDIEAFWEENKPNFAAMERQARNQENIRSKYIIDKVRSRVEDTLKRLFNSHYYAYLMLCMGAELECFAEKIGWLMVLCDAPEKEQDLAFATLKKRFLLEWEKPQNKVLYRLHNLIQNVAQEHLDKIEED